ncbi:PXA domain-containing protein [Spinellus fusiger]|nr:PXA domain-containing protein [Spinellus fusiger]
MPVFAAVSDTEEESSTEDQFVSAHQTLALFYPPLTLAVSSAIELFLKQFVSEWWVPLNEHNHPAFLQSVRARLHAATANLEKILFKQKKHDLVMSTVFGVANTLIIHMRECRAYEDSGISLDTYILHYPHSAFAQLLSREEQENQLRQLATTILKRLMLKSDVGSGVLVCLLRELLATHLLGTLMKTCSDPDFINCLMVKHLLKETVEQQALSLLKRSKEDDDVRWFKRKSTADSQIDIPKREEIKTRPPHSSPNEAPLPTEDVELLIETTFALVVELFDLSTKNNKAWVRRSLLNLLREIVRRSYTQLVAEHYNDSIQALLSPEALTQHVSELAQTFWPQGQWTPPPHRSDDEKQSTKRQARTLLMHHAIPGTLRQLIGDQNCTQSMETLWTRLQDPLLNRVLILQLLERTLKPLFG